MFAHQKKRKKKNELKKEGTCAGCLKTEGLVFLVSVIRRDNDRLLRDMMY